MLDFRVLCGALSHRNRHGTSEVSRMPLQRDFERKWPVPPWTSRVVKHSSSRARPFLFSIKKNAFSRRQTFVEETRAVGLILSKGIYVSASHHRGQKWSVGTVGHDNHPIRDENPIFRSRNRESMPNGMSSLPDTRCARRLVAHLWSKRHSKKSATIHPHQVRHWDHCSTWTARPPSLTKFQEHPQPEAVVSSFRNFWAIPSNLSSNTLNSISLPRHLSERNNSTQLPDSVKTWSIA